MRMDRFRDLGARRRLIFLIGVRKTAMKGDFEERKADLGREVAEMKARLEAELDETKTLLRREIDENRGKPPPPPPNYNQDRI